MKNIYFNIYKKILKNCEKENIKFSLQKTATAKNIF